MKKMIAAVAMVLAMASMASAAVTFDPATGVGFVGKGDVQLGFGWNNTTLQSNASGVKFSFNTTDSYNATCEWITGEGTKAQKLHTVNHSTKTEVASTVASTLRQNKQLDVTGFNLVGLGVSTASGFVPVVGESCTGSEGHDGVWVEVTQEDSSLGGLYVNNGTQTVLLQSAQ